MNNEDRETASDATSDPVAWHVYILKLDAGGTYVGQTNNLEARLAEHASGTGAHATKEPHRLVWFNQTYDRDSARRMEGRLKRSLARDGALLDQLVERFTRLARLALPAEGIERDLKQLEVDRAKRHDFMITVNHIVTKRYSNGAYGAACGWQGENPGNHATRSWRSRREKLHNQRIPIIYGYTGESARSRVEADDAVWKANNGKRGRQGCPECLDSPA